MLLNTAVGAVSLLLFTPFVSLVLLVQAQRYTTLLTRVCHGRRVCTPPCSFVLSLPLLIVVLSITAILSLLLLFVLLR